MSATITINHPSFDRIYSVYAWRNNNIGLGLVQGEGVTIPDEETTVVVDRAKAPRFLLRDEREVIDLSGEDTYITWAVTLPCGGGEELIECNIIQPATQGVIEIPITTSVTTYHGMAYGEIRVATDSGTIKFSGINAKIACGVSDNAIEHSSRFSGLISALQKVVTIDTDRVAQMDSLDEYGDLPTYGTNPVASGALKQYLQGKYINDIEQSRGYVNENEMNDAIAEAIRGIATFGFSIVSELPPVSDAYTNKIYLVPNDSTSQDPVYDQWVVIDNEWVYLGSTQVDISNKADKATTLAGYGITDAYTSAQTDAAISDAIRTRLKFEIVQTLPPIPGSYSNIIYLVPNNDGDATNIYDEWIVVNQQWEHLGSTQIDISGKVDKKQTIAGLALSGNIGSAALAEAMAGDINPVGVIPGTTSGYGAQFGRSSAGKPVMHTLSKDWKELALASDVSGKQDKQTDLPEVRNVDVQGRWVVDTTDPVFVALGIGQGFYSIFGEVPITHLKTGSDTYLRVNGILHNGDIPTNVSAFTNDAGYLTAHQDISGKADKATSLAGYGITDAYTKTQVDEAIPESVNDLNDGNLYVRKYEGSSEPPSSPVTNQYPVPCLWYYERDVWFLYDRELIPGSGVPRYQYYFDKLIPVVPSKTSDLTNDSGFLIARDINGKMDLAPIRATIDDDTQIKQGQLIVVNDEVWLKHKAYGAAGHKTLAEKSTTLAGYGITDAYTKAEVNSAIAGITTLNFLVVQTLPTTDISTTTIYLVQKTTSQIVNVYDEYLYVNSSWELIGSTAVDVSNKADKATTLSVYRITDAYTKSQSDGKFLTAHQDISGKENTSNKITSISGSITNTQYPSALAVKNYVDSVIGGIENGSY